ncbi:hypothetical protein CbuD7D7780_00005 [Coxiella burnetii]|nr:hypothetical protein CbuD7E6568_00005 [Coxiella burnetii]OYK83166.1 hypothetical protein CbuD7D7780_00005 [Coxiella burnetii]
MSEAKYGKTMMSSIVPVFRFAHTGYLASQRQSRFHFKFHFIASRYDGITFEGCEEGKNAEGFFFSSFLDSSASSFLTYSSHSLIREL